MYACVHVRERNECEQCIGTEGCLHAHIDFKQSVVHITRKQAAVTPVVHYHQLYDIFITHTSKKR